MRVEQTTPHQAEHTFRLNPFSLPAHYEATTADGVQTNRSVYLDRTMAIVRRKVAGLPLNVKMPIKKYQGVAIQYDVAGDGTPCVEISLQHRDPAMNLTLSRGNDTLDVSADWQAWANLFGLPLLIKSETGEIQPAKGYLGSLIVSATLERRYHAQFAERRPRFLTRRKPGRKGPQSRYNEREIIART